MQKSLLLFFALLSSTSYSVTLDEKIGQMIMLGFSGSDLSSNIKLKDDIKNKRVGGVILYKKERSNPNYHRSLALNKITKDEKIRES